MHPFSAHPSFTGRSGLRSLALLLPCVLLALLALAQAANPARAEGVLPVYSIIDLPPLPGGTMSFAASVNSAGDAVGWTHGGDFGSNPRATLWPAGGGAPVNLGALPGSSRSIATDINDNGLIVGHSNGQAVVWEDRVISVLPPLQGDSGGFAYSVNNSGVIVGDSRSAGVRPVSWTNRQPTLLFNSVGYWAISINDSGDITGGGRSQDGFDSGWVIRGGNFIPLGTTGVFARGMTINNNGLVGGFFTNVGVFWLPPDYGSAGAVFSPATGRSEVDSINSYNQAVGYHQEIDRTLTALFARSNEFRTNSTPRPLADYLPANSGFTRLMFASSISERGQITGEGVRANGDFHAFLMTPPAVDLAVISQTDDPDPTTKDSQVVYTFTVKNKGAAPAEGVRVTSTLNDLSFVAIGGDPTGTESTRNGNVITWAFTSRILEPGEEITFSVFARTINSGTASNEVTITTPVHSEINPGDNSLTESTVVQGQVDLEVQVTDVPDPALVNEQITYSISLRNAGPDPANQVRLTATPSNLNLISVTAPGATVQQNEANVVMTYNDPLPSGSVLTITIVGRAPVTGTASLQAAAATSDVDTDPGDNEGTASTTINPLPADVADLAVSISDSPDPVVLGNQISYDIDVLNRGPNPATGVLLEIRTVRLSDVRVRARGGSVNDRGSGRIEVTFDRLTLRPNGSIAVRVTGRVNDVGGPVLSASVSADQADSDPSNNHEEEQTTLEAPDLVGGEINIQHRRVRGKSTIIGTAAVRNIGTAAARASVTAFYLLPPGQTFDPDVTPQLRSVRTPAIPANASRTIRLNLRVPPGVDPSGHVLLMYVDGVPRPNGRVAELNEDNINSSAMVPNPDGTFPP